MSRLNLETGTEEAGYGTEELPPKRRMELRLAAKALVAKEKKTGVPAQVPTRARGNALNVTEIDGKKQGYVHSSQDREVDTVEEKTTGLISDDEQDDLRYAMGKGAPAELREEADVLEALRAAIKQRYTDGAVDRKFGDIYGAATGAAGLMSHLTGGDGKALMSFIDRGRPSADQPSFKDMLKAYTDTSKNSMQNRLKYGQLLLADTKKAKTMLDMYNKGEISEGDLAAKGLSPAQLHAIANKDRSHDMRAHDKATAFINHNAPIQRMTPRLKTLAEVVSKFPNDKAPGFIYGFRNKFDILADADDKAINAEVTAVIGELVKLYSGVAARPEEVKAQEKVLGNAFAQGPAAFRKQLKVFTGIIKNALRSQFNVMHKDAQAVARGEYNKIMNDLESLDFDYKGSPAGSGGGSKKESKKDEFDDTFLEGDI